VRPSTGYVCKLTQPFHAVGGQSSYFACCLWLLAAGCYLSTVLLSAVCCLLSTNAVCCLLSCCLLSALSAVCCLLSVSCLLSAVCQLSCFAPGLLGRSVLAHCTHARTHTRTGQRPDQHTHTGQDQTNLRSEMAANLAHRRLPVSFIRPERCDNGA
jgi:hypothetical protein